MSRIIMALAIGTMMYSASAFSPLFSSRPKSFAQLKMSENIESELDLEDPKKLAEDVQRQWDLFTKHHVKGRWRGTWTTYDYMGDEVDSTMASVLLQPKSSPDEKDDFITSVIHEHEIITGITSADCNTCFDSTQARTIPVATYQYEKEDDEIIRTNLAQRKIRCASVGMCVGPTLLRSGAMSTEMILRHGDSRLRVIFMHGPAWEKGVEPGSCPPMGLKLFRTILSRESINRPFPGPTAQNERENPPTEGNPQFFRPVPPFQWHAKWEGSSWTYGSQTGDKGWSITDMEEKDAWHGRPTGDNENVWNMRLPGGILIQCPRMVYSGEVGLCRVAWMPEGERGPHMLGSLLRLEAGISALEPILSEDDEEMMVGFYPPSMVSLRCDTLRKTGELEGTSMLEDLKKI